jgi:hypothetical protein
MLFHVLFENAIFYLRVRGGCGESLFFADGKILPNFFDGYCSYKEDK